MGEVGVGMGEAADCVKGGRCDDDLVGVLVEVSSPP